MERQIILCNFGQMSKATYLLHNSFLLRFGTLLDEMLRKFKSDAMAALGDNLICLMHHGSRAKGEAHPESDYDVIIIIRRINGKVLNTVRNLFFETPSLLHLPVES